MQSATQVPVTETYEDVRKLLYSLCHKFQRKFGGDFEELLSEAHVAFMSAYKTFDSDLGQFSTLVATCVKNRLLDMMYREHKRKMTSLDQDRDDVSLSSLVEDKHREFDFDSYADGLSEDSQFVLKLALHPSAFVKEKAVERGDQPRNWRSAIRDHLREIGWSYPQIYEAFGEIKATIG